MVDGCLQFVQMLQSILASVGDATLQRAVLWINHLLTAEPMARQRLQAHAGKHLRLELTDWPAALPPPPPARLSVTPAGLFEAADPVSGSGEGAPLPPADLVLRIAASDPAGWLVALTRGEPPAVDVQGDAQLASELQWLAANLRWDIEGDLANVTGGPVAHQVALLGRTLRDGLRRWIPPAPDATRRP